MTTNPPGGGPLLGRLQRALHGRYTVEHELGRGGMAVVYLGHDQRLERRVAIKVFEKEGGLISAGERFLREIQVAAKLQHPNILPVFESGEGEGLVYYVMPYVAGGSVRERLEREGPLPVADAVRIAREVAEALDHAHKEGIVHRDIKPDNIMLAHGVAVVADFGIARAIEQSGAKVTTDTGLAIGTPTYMSPEQAAASPQLDGRTDIYSLGCVLYEMLAGSPPFSGATAQQVMARHATDTAPPLGTVRKVPPALEAAIQQALAKLPADRWPTGGAFAGALTESGMTPSGTQPVRRRSLPRAWLAVGAIVLLAGAAIAKLTYDGLRTSPAVTDTDSVPSIAVLPFALIGDSAQAHYAAGLTEAVINALVNVGGVRVPGPATVARYRGGAQDPVAIGRELQVQTVLTGSVQIAGPTLRVLPRMVRVSDGSVLWTSRYDGEIANVFTMQDSVIERIIGALRIQLTASSREALSRGVGTTNQDAYNLYLLGRSFYVRADTASLIRALDYFGQAAARDSHFVAPLVGLLDTYSLLANVEPVRHRRDWKLQGDLLRRAMAIDSTYGEVYLHLAEARNEACDIVGVEQAYAKALRYAPGSALVRRDYAVYLLGLGRNQEAVQMSQESARIDPTSPWVLAVLVDSYLTAGNKDSALAVSERALSLDTTQWVPHAVRGAALADVGRTQEGIAHVETSRRLGGASHALTNSLLGRVYGMAGRRQEALEIARVLAGQFAIGAASREDVARVYAGLGDRKTEAEWLAKPPVTQCR